MSCRQLLNVKIVWKSLSKGLDVSSKRFYKQTDIPGPRYIPFLGPLNDLLTMGQAERLHLTMDNYHKKYGPIVHIKLSGIDSVFLSSADYMRSMFLHEGKHPKHILPPAWLYFNQKHKLKRGLLFMDDEEWLKHRQILNQLLLKDYQWVEHLLELTCDTFVAKIKRTTSEVSYSNVENLEKELYLWSGYSILNIMLGSSTAEQSDRKFDEKVIKLVTRFGQIMKLSAKLMSIPPSFADKCNLKIWNDFETEAQETVELTRSIISALSNEMESSDNGLLNKMKFHNFSEEIIVRLFSDLLIAAGDTSVAAVQWYLHMISKDVEYQERLRKHIVKNLPDCESPLVRAGLRETLRLYPIASFVGRFLDSDAKVGQHTVPAGWLAIASLYTSGRDPNNFTEPLKFSPERWIRDEHNQTDNKVLKPHATLPFAMGRRSCIGKKVANYQIHCLITKIIKNFILKSLNEEEVNFKLELIGVPDKQILIAFRNALP